MFKHDSKNIVTTRVVLQRNREQIINTFHQCSVEQNTVHPQSIHLVYIHTYLYIQLCTYIQFCVTLLFHNTTNDESKVNVTNKMYQLVPFIDNVVINIKTNVNSIGCYHR